MSVTVDSSHIQDKEALCVNEVCKFSGGKRSVPIYLEKDNKMRIPMVFAIQEKIPFVRRRYRKIDVKDTIVLRDYQEKHFPKMKELLDKRNGAFLQVYCSWGKTLTSLKL